MIRVWVRVLVRVRVRGLVEIEVKGLGDIKSLKVLRKIEIQECICLCVCMCGRACMCVCVCETFSLLREKISHSFIFYKLPQ